MLDTVLCAYRLAEDRRVLLPVLVCQDAFVLSHTMMLTDVPGQEQVDRFLPPLDLPHHIDGAPRVMGGARPCRTQTEVHRVQHQNAMERVWRSYQEVQDEFEAVFGRRPADPIDARTGWTTPRSLVVSMGTTPPPCAAGGRRRARARHPAGGLRVRMFRPFPAEQLAAAFRGRGRIAVIDRNMSPGLGGMLWGEARGWPIRTPSCRAT